MNDTKKYSPPKGIYLTTWDWIKHYHVKSGKYYRSYYKHPMVNLRKPKGLEDSIHWKFESKYKENPPPTFVTVIPNGRVFGQHGSIITPDSKLIWDLSFEYDKAPKQHSIFDEVNLPPYRKTTKTIAVITFSAEHYYYHWMFDILPRLHLLKKRKIRIDKIIMNGNLPLPFVEQTLAALKIPRSKIMNTSSSLHLKAKRVVVPSLLGYTGYMPRWAVQFLRKKFLNKEIIKNPEYERIYISRKFGRGRRVLNEVEVVQFLSLLGFKELVLEEMTLDEQIQIFFSAKVIVAPHGGGLTNLVFSNPDTKVLEIFSPFYVNPLYWVLSNYLHLDYYYLLGEGKGIGEYLDHLRVEENITINIEKLTKMIQKMNII